MLKSLLFMFLTASALGYPLQPEQPPQPKQKYFIRTTALNKSITDLGFVINDIATSNISDPQKQVWVNLIAGVRDSLIVNANDSLLQVTK